jgi:16S rRNA (cytosine1402-N4)-methyltransferase
MPPASGLLLMPDSRPLHVPVLLQEIIDWLDPQPGQTFVDGTLGGGGHARALAERVGPEGLVLALDRDPAAIEAASVRLKGLPLKVAVSNYADLRALLDDLGIVGVQGILLDLGLSSDQIADPERGFSFDASGDLDLRFDPTSGEPAWRLLQRLDERELADLIYEFGEERFSRRIARKIVALRGETPIRSADQIAAIVRSVVPRSQDTARIDPATRTFQALRIAVNDELGSLRRALASMPDCLLPSGRLAIISFHSLEDRLVKWAFREDPRWEPLTKKPVMASDEEMACNPRSRSAKLRVAQRT